MSNYLDDQLDAVKRPDCPSWCVLHVNGAHVGELEDPPADAPATPGHHVYARRRQEADGTPAVEIVVQENGGSIIQLVEHYGSDTAHPA